MLEFDTKFKPKIGKKAKEFIENSFGKLKKEKDSKSVGYYTLPNTTTALFEKIENYIKQNEDLRNNRIRNVAVIGIGGSSLGTKAIDSILRFKNHSDINLLFLENGDPININQNLKNLNKDDTIFIIISKSGTTIETTSIFKYILD
ncbi:MAG: glucose-6-phosphate isomerase, partial [Arcobacteraceae bacterium]|nr:glucose-6-phosphate isomerase [Arcobacteraceae bacterium]